MGLYDRVKFEADCPGCGAHIKEWQTKDGDPCMQAVDPKDIWNWYALCRCGRFIEYGWERDLARPPTMTCHESRFAAIKEKDGNV